MNGISLKLRYGLLELWQKTMTDYRLQADAQRHCKLGKKLQNTSNISAFVELHSFREPFGSQRRNKQKQNQPCILIER